MRQFIIIGHKAPTAPDFSLEDTAGAGRLDVLCRCVTGAFFLSHSIRSDVQCRLVLADTYTIRFEGSELRGLHPDERSTAARIKSTLEHRDHAIGHMETSPSPGVYLSQVGVETTLTNAAEEGTVIELHEDGQPISTLDLPTDPVFVLSDHRDFTETETELLSETATERVRLGPEPLHADQAITLAHHCLDTNGYTEL